MGLKPGTKFGAVMASPGSIPGAVVLALGLLVSSGAGCEDIFPPREAAPSRVRSVRQPDWTTVQENDGGAVEALQDVAAQKKVPAAAPTPEPEIRGLVGSVLAVYEQSFLVSRRTAAVKSAVPKMTEADVSEAYKAILSGKRLRAEVGIALLTGYYSEKEAWDEIDRAYGQLFDQVPELSVDPRYILERAIANMKSGRYQDALDMALQADKYFRQLPVGQSSLYHQARLAECQAWSYEGLARQAIKQVGSEEQVTKLENRAIESWRTYITLMRAQPERDDTVAEQIKQAEDRVRTLQQSAR